MRRQPFGPPSDIATDRAWRAAGLLVDVAGRTLPTARRPCAFCDGDDLGDTCPAALTCPTCRAGPRTRCLRPSGHAADQWHRARVRAADTEDQRREDDGETNLPARWAGLQPGTNRSRGKR